MEYQALLVAEQRDKIKKVRQDELQLAEQVHEPGPLLEPATSPLPAPGVQAVGKASAELQKGGKEKKKKKEKAQKELETANMIMDGSKFQYKSASQEAKAAAKNLEAKTHCLSTTHHNIFRRGRSWRMSRPN